MRWTAMAVVPVMVASLVSCTDLPDEPGNPAIVRWGGDVLGGGSSVRLSEGIPGDAIVAGSSVSVSGPVAGNWIGAGRDVAVEGGVGGSVVVAGGTVRVGAAVERNVLAAGGTVVIGPEAGVGRNAYLAGGRVEVSGPIEGSLRVGANDAYLDGSVAGDVVVEAGTLALGPNARISGNLDYRMAAGGPATFDPSSIVSGLITEAPPREDEGAVNPAAFRVLRVLAFLLAGGLVVALFPVAAARAAEAAKTRTLAAFGFGFIGLVAVPIGIALVVVTVIGIPTALIAAPLFLASLYLAPIPASIWLGGRLLSDVPRPRWGRVREFLLGGAIVAVLGFVPVAGFILRAVVTLLGLGAAGLALRSRPTAEAVSTV